MMAELPPSSQHGQHDLQGQSYLARPAARIALRLLPGLPWAAIVLLATLNVLYVSRLGPNDDAFITYRVARNLASGRGFAYNPGERVLSITTPGYALLLAAVSFISKDFVALGLTLGACALLAVGALLICLSRTEGRPTSPPCSPDQASPVSSEQGVAVTNISGLSWLSALAVSTLTLTFPLLSEALGMETPLYLVALLATFAAYSRALRAEGSASHLRWLRWTAVAAASAFLLRPDGLLAGLVVGLHWLALRLRNRPGLAVNRGRLPWGALGLGLGLTVPWVAFAWLYFGSPIPNTLAAKQTQALGNQVTRWGPELLLVARDWAISNPLAAALAAIGLVGSLTWRRQGRLLLVLWAVLYAIAHTLLRVRSYFWYYVPLVPVVALLAGDGFGWLVGWLDGWLVRWLGEGRAERRRSGEANRSGWQGWTRRLMVLGLLAATLYPSVLAAAKLAAEPLPRRRDVAYRQTAEVLRRACKAGREDLTVGMAEIGLLGYLSNCRVIDFAGLLQPDIAHLRGRSEEKVVWAIKRYAPSLVVLSGGMRYPHEVANARWFRRRYEPVAIFDEGGFRSVIYRRGLGPSEQRDLPGVTWWRQSAAAGLAQPTVEATAAGQVIPNAGLGQPYTTALYFPIAVRPAITLHAYLPPGSFISIAANGHQVVDLVGKHSFWGDYPLPADALPTGQVVLRLAGLAGEQPAAVAWVESNALPAVYYFVPLEDASLHPRPTVRLDSGQSITVTLAPANEPPLALELLHRDWPGVQLAIWVNGQRLGQVGGSDGWRKERLALPPDPGPAVTIKLRSQGEHYARVAYVALVPFIERTGSHPQSTE